VCRGKEKIEGCGRYLKKRVIYIYECKWVCAIRKQKKKTCFLSIRPREEKQIQARKISQFKSVKALVIAW
jgi:hypothetical protein